MTAGGSLSSPRPHLPPQRPQQPPEDVGDYQPSAPLFTTRTPEGRILIVLAIVDIGLLVAFLCMVSLTVYRAGGLVPTISAVSSESEVLLAAGTFAALWVAVQTERRESERDRKSAERLGETVSPTLRRQLEDAKSLPPSGSPIEPRAPAAKGTAVLSSQHPSSAPIGGPPPKTPPPVHPPS